MITEQLIEQWFLQAVAHNNKAPLELKKAILKKPVSVQTYLKALHNTINKEQQQRKIQNKKDFKKESLMWLVQSLAENWINTAESLANGRIMSDNERLRVSEEKKKIKELDDTISGKPSDEFKEYMKDGLILDDTLLGDRSKSID